MPVETLEAKLQVGRLVSLFQLDITDLGGSIIYFTPNAGDQGADVLFQGISYSPIDVQMDGFEMSGRSVLPRPIIKIANTNFILTNLLYEFKDLIGAKVTRIRTFEEFLDGSPTADPNAHYPIDQYIVMQKSMVNKLYIEFTLASSIDVEGQKIPRRIVLHNFCGRRYRVWNPVTNLFDYSKASCPYVGTAYFKSDPDLNQQAASGNTSTNNPALDKCSKTLAGCQKRFGVTALPGWFFPGAGRF